MNVSSIPDFDAVYDRMILGRNFVEYADYYRQSRARYRQVLEVIGSLRLPPGARHLDIGGGQIALLSQALLGFQPAVGDVVDSAEADVVAQGAAFQRINLIEPALPPGGPFDLISFCEVIEHIPFPPYVTFRKLIPILKPGGWIVLTTPNGFRIRNILRMLANREVLDIYRYPDGDQPLGHQHDWQLREAGFTPSVLRTYVSSWRGASIGARVAHVLTKPFNLAPHLRDGIMVAAQATRRPE